jgi:hypothetical protein
LGDEEWISIHLQIFGNLGGVAFQIRNGFDIGSGMHDRPLYMDGSEFSTEFG